MMRGRKAVPEKKEAVKPPPKPVEAPKQPEILGPSCHVCGGPVAPGQNAVCIAHQRYN